jgi:general stress protein 26
MPGYLPPGAGGTLPWSWAEERLVRSHSYWVATVWPDGRPHISPVWGGWFDGAFWFSCDLGSRKARNIATNPQCVVTTEDPLEPVVVDGVATAVMDRALTARYVEVEREKYASEWDPELYTVDFFDGNLGGGCTFRLSPRSALGLLASEFATSPTRWRF